MNDVPTFPSISTSSYTLPMDTDKDPYLPVQRRPIQNTELFFLLSLNASDERALFNFGLMDTPPYSFPNEVLAEC